MSTTITASGRLTRWRTIDLLTCAFLGVAFGVAYWAWGLAYAAPSDAISAGFPPLAARRPERAVVNMDWGFEGDSTDAAEGELAREEAITVREGRGEDEGFDDDGRGRRSSLAGALVRERRDENDRHLMAVGKQPELQVGAAQTGHLDVRYQAGGLLELLGSQELGGGGKGGRGIAQRA